jgi:hypothetical protein
MRDFASCADSHHRVFQTLSTSFSTAMKIKPEQIDRLTDDLVKAYGAKQLIVLKASESDVRAKIKEVLNRNFREEELIEEEARQMLASHAGQTREMDQHRLFLLTKQRLAQKRGFVL